MSATRPTLRFLFTHPAHFIALGFGSGLAPFAPGTFGTLVAIPIAWGLWAVTGNAGFAVAIVATFAIGVWASAVTSRNLGVSDHGGIVIDEIAAFLLVLFFVGAEPIRVGVAFLLFRFFDIVKLPPAREIDRHWHGGLGVMLDDVVAAGYALVVFAIVVRLQGALGAAA
jgi:phosphatidylglycerophosphatase A